MVGVLSNVTTAYLISGVPHAKLLQVCSTSEATSSTVWPKVSLPTLPEASSRMAKSTGSSYVQFSACRSGLTLSLVDRFFLSRSEGPKRPNIYFRKAAFSSVVGGPATVIN